MSNKNMVRGYIPFYTKLVQSPETVSEVVWVKGNMQPFKLDGVYDVSDTPEVIMEIEVEGRIVYTKTNPFPNAVYPDYELYFIDPKNNKSYRVRGEADWTTLAGRGAKHLKLKGDREGSVLFPTQPSILVTPNSVEDYEDSVLRLKIMTNIINKGV